MSAVVTLHPRWAELVARRALRAKVERAVERLLAVLDELDADPEAEPWLGAPEASVFAPQWLRSSTDDREEQDEDGGDVLDTGEETLGWNENVRQVGLGQNTADADVTAPERHGLGFMRCGPDDHEDAHSAGSADRSATAEQMLWENP